MDVTEAAATLDRARQGDSEAFRALVERHSRTVFRLAFRMTGNEQDAEDVVQESFLRAYRQLDRFESRAQFRHLALSHRRQLLGGSDARQTGPARPDAQRKPDEAVALPAPATTRTRTAGAQRPNRARVVGKRSTA